MKPITVFGTWLLTLLVGFFVATVALQSPYFGLIFTAIAAFCSLGYLVMMLIFAFIMRNFWQQQIVHFISTVITMLVLLIVDEDYITDLYWVPSIYFAVALLIQFLVNKSINTPKEIQKNASE